MSDAVKQKNKRLVLQLLLLVVGMMGVGLALIPLYDVFTDASGINGKLELSANAQALHFAVDQNRVIRVDLITSVAKDTPLRFTVEPKQIQVHPGQEVVVQYTARNTSGQAVNVHANPSVAPGLAAAYFKLLECFCAGNQSLAAGETKQLQIRFVVDPKLSALTKDIALALQYFKTK